MPEVVTEGDTEDEALAMAEDAIRLVLGYRRDNGIPIPGHAEPTVPAVNARQVLAALRHDQNELIVAR
ncbi:MAG TPA: type II toxin-antitoxin system HicB family antitoxin [Acetobacteraceae bacterium]|nr:type II toxin-antitoxin system HicB family antitoxin [Acetobacteraceae bacterium]